MGEIQGPAGRERRVETRKRVLGKSQRLLCHKAPIEDFYAFIEQEKAVFPITWMCKRLGVSRASYYRWVNPTGLTPTATRHLKLKGEVAQECENSNQMAGRDQLTTLLNQRGVNVSSGTVGSIMNELGLRARRMRTWKNTTVSDPAARTEHIKNHMLDKHGNGTSVPKCPGPGSLATSPT